jgi:hypothetical protein
MSPVIASAQVCCICFVASDHSRLARCALGRKQPRAMSVSDPKRTFSTNSPAARLGLLPARCYAWFLILLRISVMCFGYSPLKYSKVSGLAV